MHPTTATPAVSARSLIRTYGSTHALAGVDLDIAHGESLAIMGASGSGKTTLLHVLAGIVKPDGGSVVLGAGASQVRLDTLDDAGRSRVRRERLGFVFQQGLLIPELTALENVAIALMLKGVSRADAQAHAAGWLAHLGLAGMESRRIGELSGGQAQRVAIARAQVTGAELVFADEPTGALDSATSTDVMSTLLSATIGRGATLVLVTHDRAVADRCSRVVTLVDGRIVSDTAQAAAATTGSLAAEPGSSAATTGSAAATQEPSA